MEVALKYGLDLVATKKIQAALLASDLAQDLLIKGDVNGAITTLTRSMHKDLNYILTMSEFVEALEDTVIKAKFERIYGKDSASKFYSAVELIEKMNAILDEQEMMELNTKIQEADFKWWVLLLDGSSATNPVPLFPDGVDDGSVNAILVK